jgi:hypothetical protein
MTNLENEAREYIASQLIELDLIGEYIGDIHHKIANEDYFIIGRYRAKVWIEATTGVFEAIELIQTYESEVFGESYTDLSDPEKVANMLMYIACDELLSKSDTLQSSNERLTGDQYEQLLDEFKNN